MENREIIKEGIKLSFWFMLCPNPILNKLYEDNRIPRPLIIRFARIFKKYGLYEFAGEPLNPTFTDRAEFLVRKRKRQDYFNLVVFGGLFTEIYEQLVSENYKIIDGDTSYNSIYIHKSHFDDFIKKYSKYFKGINWYDLLNQNSIRWQNHHINAIRNHIDWRRLTFNTRVEWNFDMVRENKDYIDWDVIYNCPKLVWNEDLITEFREYLKFKKSNFASVRITSEDTRNCSHPYTTEPDEYYYSISSSLYVDWSFNLIYKFRDLWNWEELSANNNIKWNAEEIKKFKNHLDFNSLSENRSVIWTEELIEIYKNLWDWEHLSGNTSLPWSFKFILKYRDRWIWRLKEHLKDGERDDFHYIFTDNRNDLSSLSTNSGIRWTVQMLEKWKNRVNFWDIARNGIIEDEAIRKFHFEFSIIHSCELSFHSFSDFTRFTEKIKRSAWENLADNPQFKISKDMLDFFYAKKIKKRVAMGNFSRRGKEEYKSQNIKVLEFVKECPINDLEFDDLFRNSGRWLKVLFNEDFVNGTLWNQFFKGYFTEDVIEIYLQKQFELMQKANETSI